MAALNIGGVANITLIGEGDDLLAFDTGPGNGMIDLMLQERGLGRFDENGRLAAAGKVDQTILDAFLASDYFAGPAPKSLDRYDFPLDLVEPLSAEDAAATSLGEAQKRLDDAVAEIRGDATLDPRAKEVKIVEVQQNENRKFELEKAQIEGRKPDRS